MRIKRDDICKRSYIESRHSVNLSSSFLPLCRLSDAENSI